MGEGTGFRNPTAATIHLNRKLRIFKSIPPSPSQSVTYLMKACAHGCNTGRLLHIPANCLLRPSQRGLEPDALMTLITLICPISERSSPARGEGDGQGRRCVVQRHRGSASPAPRALTGPLPGSCSRWVRQT